MIERVSIVRYESDGARRLCEDRVAVEEPLSLRVEGQLLAVTMRTPGQDLELAAGWALAEGIVHKAADIVEIIQQPGDENRSSAVDILLREPARFSAEKHRRALVSMMSCGICGAATVAQALRAFPKIESAFLTNAKVLAELPARMSAAQPLFEATGGVHACALFDGRGDLLTLREDAGRHNALDKLAGWALRSGRLPLSQSILLLSGRVSHEMMLKALASGIPVVVAIGAPSSLAVRFARASGQMLVAFIRRGAFNVYAGAERLG